MDFFLFEDQTEMPAELLTAEGEYFSHCKQCEKNLQDPPQAYTLEKVFKRYPNTSSPQVLFEYAICDDCAGDIRGDFSEESAENMQRYFADKLQEREETLSDEINVRLNTCLLTNAPLAEEQE
jgi:hypothetical protein